MQPLALPRVANVDNSRWSLYAEGSAKETVETAGFGRYDLQKLQCAVGMEPHIESLEPYRELAG